MAPICGSPKADCKGVKEAMRLPRYVDLVSPMALGILTSIVGDEGGVDLLDLSRCPNPPLYFCL
jgi:hypothetical protein